MATGQVFTQRFYYRESLTRYDAHQGEWGAPCETHVGVTCNWHRYLHTDTPRLVGLSTVHCGTYGQLRSCGTSLLTHCEG
jgi:hypothetical protein